MSTPPRISSHNPRIVGASLRVLGAALAAGSVAGAAFADEAATDVSDVIVTGQPYRKASILKETDTGSRMGISAFETPASIYILSGDEMRLRGDTNIQDAVTRAVGITSQAQVGNGNTGLASRGFVGVSSIQVLYDGQAIAIGGGTVSFPYDPWTVERIEVLGGPSSVLYGGGAIGGVVNVISRKPSMERETLVRVSAGTYDTYKAAIDTTGPIGDHLAYRLAFSRIQSDGWVQRGKSHSNTFAGQLQWRPSNDLTVTLSSDYGDQHPMNYYGLPLIGGVVREDLKKVNFNVADARTWFHDQWTRLKAEWQPAENITISNTAYYMTVKREWFRSDIYTWQPATNLIRRTSYSDVAHDQKQWGLTGNVAISGQIGGMTNNFSVGYEYSDIDFTHINNGPYAGFTLTDIYNSNPGLYAGGALSPFYPRYHSDSTQLALFAENRLQVTDRLSLIGGLRWDKQKQDRYDLDTRLLTKAKFDPVSYRAGVVYAVTPQINVYGQYAKANDFFGNLISLAPAQQALKLPTGRQIEVGFKQATLDGKFEWTLAAYRIVKKNLLVADPTNPLQSVQIGQQSSRGIEATAALQLPHGLGINVNGTILKGKYDDYFVRSGATTLNYKGNRPSSVPTSSFNAWLYWDANERLRVHSAVRYVSDTYVNDSNTEKARGYTLLDFGARYQLTEKVVVDALVRNAFDKFYTSGFRANSVTGGGQQIVQPGRTFEVSATARF